VNVSAFFFALVAVGHTGAGYDAGAHRLEARGAAAADLRAPSAAVARVKAERTARARAEKKLAAALVELGLGPCDAGDCAAALARSATVADERYGSDGSVELTLRLSTDGLALHR
jgi:hypothetical protein